MKLKLPLFIVIEGIDGSGKSTISDKIYKYFIKRGIQAEKFFEPTDGEWGQKIRRLLKDDGAKPEQLVNLFILDREDDAVKNIYPNLNKNKMIIMDRYYFSNAAYQGAMGISPHYILNENMKKKFPRPDRVYLIDIDPDIALSRVSKRNRGKEKDIFEKKEFLKNVRDIYLSIVDETFVVLDGTLDIKSNFDLILQDIEKNFL